MRQFRFKGYTGRIQEAVIDAMAPRWSDHDPHVEARVLRSIENTLAAAPRSIRYAYCVGLWGLEFLAPLLSGGRRPLSQVPRGARIRRLERLNTHSVALLRRWIQLYRILVNLAAYSDPGVERYLGADRRFWSASRRRFRAALIAADRSRETLPPPPEALGCAGVVAPADYLQPRPPKGRA